jgi:integration host factor subunit beta
MTRSELIERLSKRLGHDQQKSTIVVKVILENITETLQKGGRVEIRGFGSFSLRYRKSRIARNPRTGEKVRVLDKAIPFFKASKALKKRVNEGQHSKQ